MQIHRGHPSDLNAIQALYIACINKVCAKDYSEEQRKVWSAGIHNTVRWKKALHEQYFIVAKAKGSLLGFASLQEGTHIDFLFVSPSHQRQGVAQFLYNALVEQAKAHQAKQLTADVSITALPFFKRQGFVVVQENKNVLQGVELVNYSMLLDVSMET